MVDPNLANDLRSEENPIARLKSVCKDSSKSLFCCCKSKLWKSSILIQTWHWRYDIGPSSNGLFQWANFLLDYDIHDDRIKDGITCTDYGKYNTSYGSCIKSAMRAELLAAFGCLPPWFLNEDPKTCESGIPININDQARVFNMVVLKSSFIIIWIPWKVLNSNFCIMI